VSNDHLSSTYEAVVGVVESMDHDYREDLVIKSGHLLCHSYTNQKGAIASYFM
jgi:hypothetical protein